jgi:type I restriction enzyme R subunit
MVFSEDSRVKIPCILHLVRLGYRYLSLQEITWDEESNIFPEQFSEAIDRINPDLSAGDTSRLLADVKLLLDNDDLGKAFYERLTERSGIRLIDFENFGNNSFHVVTELTCKNGSGLTSPC